MVSPTVGQWVDVDSLLSSTWLGHLCGSKARCCFHKCETYLGESDINCDCHVV